MLKIILAFASYGIFGACSGYLDIVQYRGKDAVKTVQPEDGTEFSGRQLAADELCQFFGFSHALDYEISKSVLMSSGKFKYIRSPSLYDNIYDKQLPSNYDQIIYTMLGAYMFFADGIILNEIINFLSNADYTQTIFFSAILAWALKETWEQWYHPNAYRYIFTKLRCLGEKEKVKWPLLQRWKAT